MPGIPVGWISAIARDGQILCELVGSVAKEVGPVRNLHIMVMPSEVITSEVAVRVNFDNVTDLDHLTTLLKARLALAPTLPVVLMYEEPDFKEFVKATELAILPDKCKLQLLRDPDAPAEEAAAPAPTPAPAPAPVAPEATASPRSFRLLCYLNSPKTNPKKAMVDASTAPELEAILREKLQVGLSTSGHPFDVAS